MAKRRGFPTEMVACVIVGLVWKYTPWLPFLPFNFSRLVLIYGVPGLLAYYLRLLIALLRLNGTRPALPTTPPHS